LVKIAVKLTDKKDVKRLLATVHKIVAEAGTKIRMVIVDTLARSYEGDENSSEAMANFINGCGQIAEQFECLVLVVHHSGWSDKGRSRGHSSLWGAIDCRVKATSDPDALTACVEVERQKDGSSGQQFHLKGYVVEIGKDEDGEPLTSLVFKPTDAPVEIADPDLKGRPMDMFGILVRSGTDGLTYSEWATECKAAGIKSKDTFNNGQKALLEKGYVRKEGNKFVVHLAT
jgi:hypothetical protein